jgi:hypothetical protein
MSASDDLLISKRLPGNPLDALARSQRQMAELADREVVIPQLSGLATDLGLVNAGTIIMGNGQPLGSGFTGVMHFAAALEWPAGSGSFWNTIGFFNDVMTVGVSAADGRLYAGAGAVTLSDNGLTIVAGTLIPNIINFTYGAGGVDSAQIYSNIAGSPPFRSGSLFLSGLGIDSGVKGQVNILTADPTGATDTYLSLYGGKVVFEQAVPTLKAGSAPGTPLTGYGYVYEKSSDKNLYFKNADGTETQLSGLWARQQLTAARTYYVRTDGGDGNTGLANTAGGAFLTIQKAINAAGALDNGGFDITIQVGNGTYTGANTLKSFVGSGKIIIVGDETTPANVVISVTSGNCFSGNGVLGTYSLRGMQLKTTTSGICIRAFSLTYVEFQNIDFAASVHHIQAQNQSVITATGNWSISGGADIHIASYVGSSVNTNGRTITITGTPNFTSYFVDASFAMAYCYGMTFSGSATGARYNVSLNGVIFTNGGGANYLPGNAAGTTATGGQYN